MNVDPTIVSTVISALSILIALVSFVMNYRLKKREDKQAQELVQIQIRLQELQLCKEEEAAEKRTMSKVEAHHVLIGIKNHKLRISNTGGVTVTNVTYEIIDDEGSCAFVQDKEPFERLEPGESFDEIVLMTMNTPSKFTVVTHWEDPDSCCRSRESIVTW